MNNKLLFFVFDGVDGCGKTTQKNLFKNFLNSINTKCCDVFFPGYTKLGACIREGLLNKDFDSKNSEAFAFAVDRYLTYSTIVKPALEKGTIVLSDRYDSSSMAYQGAYLTKMLNGIINLPEADLYIIFRISPELALSRVKQRGELNKLEEDVFKTRITKLMDTYNHLDEYVKNVIYIDVTEDRSEEDISNEVIEKITDKIRLNIK